MEVSPDFSDEDRFLRWDRELSAMRSALREILVCQNGSSVHQVMVNSVRSVVDADRVSMIKGSDPSPGQILAINNNDRIDPKSEIVIALGQLGRDLGDTPPSEEALRKLTHVSGSAVALVVPLNGSQYDWNAKTGYNTSLVLEWFTSERYLKSSPGLPRVIPILVDAWQFRTIQTSPSLNYASGVKWLSAIAAVLCVIFYFVSITELTILTQGTLQPLEQRFVFVPADGFVDTLHVADGQYVKKNDLLVKLNSPQLQLQLNQIAAEIGLTDQKRDGMNITINQINPADSQATLAGSRLAGELQELDTKRQNLVDQRRWMERELERLSLRSPIDGTVIASEIDKYLENRPVRRGETLFRIVSTDHQWQIESSVVDWESGYVSSAFDRSVEMGQPLEVKYALVSAPHERKTGWIESVGVAMFEFQGQQQLDVKIGLNASTPNLRLGSSVSISIPCGRYPRWFVWSRSILDAIHRRFWF